MREEGMNGFEVMRRRCATCIYRKDWRGTPIEALEEQVREKHRGATGFEGYRVCHHQKRRGKACCKIFWDHHKDDFAAGQVAQRLKLVVYVEPKP
jgi:hypothetical protein